jgi:hypothetical protein
MPMTASEVVALLDSAERSIDNARDAANEERNHSVSYYGFQATVNLLGGILVLLSEIKNELEARNA